MATRMSGSHRDQPAHPVLLDARGQEARCLDGGDELVEGRRLAPRRRAERLLHGGEPAVEHTRSRVLTGDGVEERPEPRERIELFLEEERDRGVDALRPYQ